MLEISRPDISPDVIQEFTEKERFIKLPIVPYLQLLPAQDPITLEPSTVWEQINRPQIALINAINSPLYRFVSAALSRRLGKTYIANIIGQVATLVPYCNVLIMSPNYNLSSISFELQRRFIKHFDLEIERDNLKDRILELSNGSTVRMGSITQVDSCVGRSYNLIIFDEAALSAKGEEAFNVALRPTLDRPGSKAIFISTPRGRKNWFTKFYERGFSSEYPQWASIHADYLENSRMLESDVAEARKSMSKAEFEQEYMASFNVYEGMIFEGFDMDLVIDECPPLNECEVMAGIDPGYRDPTAFIVIAYHYSSDTFYIIDEYISAEATTAEHAKKIQELIVKYDIGNIFIDSAAAQFAGDLAYSYDISTTKAKKDVLPGIAYLQTMVEQKKVYVLSHCTNTIDMLNMYQWDTSESLQKERPLHNEYSHMADALRYAIYTYTR
jgi:hypothetical protein